MRLATSLLAVVLLLAGCASPSEYKGAVDKLDKSAKGVAAVVRDNLDGARLAERRLTHLRLACRVARPVTMSIDSEHLHLKLRGTPSKQFLWGWTRVRRSLAETDRSKVIDWITARDFDDGNIECVALVNVALQRTIESDSIYDVEAQKLFPVSRLPEEIRVAAEGGETRVVNRYLLNDSLGDALVSGRLGDAQMEATSPNPVLDSDSETRLNAALDTITDYTALLANLVGVDSDQSAGKAVDELGANAKQLNTAVAALRSRHGHSTSNTATDNFNTKIDKATGFLNVLIEMIIQQRQVSLLNKHLSKGGQLIRQMIPYMVHVTDNVNTQRVATVVKTRNQLKVMLSGTAGLETFADAQRNTLLLMKLNDELAVLQPKPRERNPAPGGSANATTPNFSPSSVALLGFDDVIANMVMLARNGSQHLYADDVSDWPAFVEHLQAAGRGSAPNPRIAWLWPLLNADGKLPELLAKWDAAEKSLTTVESVLGPHESAAQERRLRDAQQQVSDVQDEIVKIVNHELGRKCFDNKSIFETFSSPERQREVTQLRSDANTNRMQRLNRMLLETAFEDPTQPHYYLTTTANAVILENPNCSAEKVSTRAMAARISAFFTVLERFRSMTDSLNK